MSEIITTPAGALTEGKALAVLLEHSIKQQRQMDAMAVQIQMMHEDIEAIRDTVRQLEKVSPSQAQALGQAVRARAVTVAADWDLRDEGQIQRITTEIRRSLRLAYGVTSFKYLPRCLYETALRRIDLWEEFDILEGMRNE